MIWRNVWLTGTERERVERKGRGVEGEERKEVPPIQLVKFLDAQVQMTDKEKIIIYPNRIQPTEKRQQSPTWVARLTVCLIVRLADHCRCLLLQLFLHCIVL